MIDIINSRFELFKMGIEKHAFWLNTGVAVMFLFTVLSYSNFGKSGGDIPYKWIPSVGVTQFRDCQ